MEKIMNSEIINTLALKIATLEIENAVLVAQNNSLRKQNPVSEVKGEGYAGLD